jgi:putative transposase
MKSNSRPDRKKLRLPDYDYSLPGAYFITACTRDREFLFNTSETRQVVQSAWHSLSDVFGGIELDEFVVMPNHVHGIVWILADGAYRLHPGTWRPGQEEDHIELKESPVLPAPNENLERRAVGLGNIVGAFKTTAAARFNKLNHQVGAIIWQKSYYDHIIRNDRELDRIREYIRYNPLKWEQDRDNPIHPSFKQEAITAEDYLKDIH